MIYKYNEFILEYKTRGDVSQKIEDFSDLYIDRIAEKLGVRLIKRLGMGSYGIAYLVDKDKVIKVTGDPKEVKNARNLMELDLEYFLNYYDVYEMTLDERKFDKKVYFILMDYVRPLNKMEKDYWNKFHADYFSSQDNEKFLDEVWGDYTWPSVKKGKKPTRKQKAEADKAVEYFKPFLKQREEMLDEASDYGIEFSDAHGANLGIRERDGAIIYFDIGHFDNVRIGDPEEDSIEVEHEIEKSDFEDVFKKIREMIKSKYEENIPIPINELVSDISQLLNINKTKAYRALRDEIYYQYRKTNIGDMGNPIFFIAKTKDRNWDKWDYNYSSNHQINPSWKKDGKDIAVVFTDRY